MPFGGIGTSIEAFIKIVQVLIDTYRELQYISYEIETLRSELRWLKNDAKQLEKVQADLHSAVAPEDDDLSETLRATEEAYKHLFVQLRAMLHPFLREVDPDKGFQVRNRDKFRFLAHEHYGPLQNNAKNLQQEIRDLRQRKISTMQDPDIQAIVHRRPSAYTRAVYCTVVADRITESPNIYPQDVLCISPSTLPSTPQNLPTPVASSPHIANVETPNQTSPGWNRTSQFNLNPFGVHTAQQEQAFYYSGHDFPSPHVCVAPNGFQGGAYHSRRTLSNATNSTLSTRQESVFTRASISTIDTVATTHSAGHSNASSYVASGITYPEYPDLAKNPSPSTSHSSPHTPLPSPSGTSVSNIGVVRRWRGKLYEEVLLNDSSINRDLTKLGNLRANPFFGHVEEVGAFSEAHKRSDMHIISLIPSIWKDPFHYSFDSHQGAKWFVEQIVGGELLASIGFQQLKSDATHGRNTEWDYGTVQIWMRNGVKTLKVPRKGNPHSVLEYEPQYLQRTSSRSSKDIRLEFLSQTTSENTISYLKIKFGSLHDANKFLDFAGFSR